MKTCSHCGNKYIDDLVRCPACGSTVIVSLDKTNNNHNKLPSYGQLASKLKSKKNLLTLSLALLVIIILLIYQGPLNKNSNQTVPESKTVEKSAESGSANNKQRAISDVVDLTSITPFYEGTIEVFKNGITDTLGNRYSTGLRGYMSPGDTDKYNVSCYNVWDIGGEFKQLTAKGIIREKDKGSSYTGSYRIYGDGKLLYQRDQIDSMTKPYGITVDITGVTDLKIEMFGNGNAGTSGINSVLVDIMLHR